jgi:hypothetical protein
MSKLVFFLIAAGFLAATVTSGWFHGRIANRWGHAGALQAAAAKLDHELPDRLGAWRLIKTIEIEPDVREKLQTAGELQGIYANDQTGEAITAVVLVGPSGPLSVHSPEICYSAIDYELAGERKQWNVTDQKGQKHSLWRLHANSRHSTKPNLRILYGWSDGDRWEAVSGPRFALAGLPVVYKLQVSGPARDNQAEPTLDPCQDFLARFLAEIQPRLLASTRTANPAR